MFGVSCRPLAGATHSHRLVRGTSWEHSDWREFITLVGGAAAAWPLAAEAQKPTMPVIGIFESGSATSLTNITAEFHAGLKESGFVEGQNVTIEYRRAS